MKKIVTIGELGIIITGNTPPRSNPKLYGNYTPFIKATDISETEKYTYHPEEYYSEEGYNKYIKSLIPKGSICVVTIGSIGKKMTMAHCDLFINQAMNAIIPNENFDNEYVYYAVKNILPNIKMLDSGTASGRENVSKSAFSKMQILIEDNIITQRRIAEILSHYDSLIENYQKQIKLLEESAQRLYKEWFVDLRFPGHENTKIVDGVPEGWEKGAVSDVVTFFDNLRKPLSSMQRMDMDKKYPYYGAASVMDYVDSYLFDGVYVLLGEDGTVITKDGYPILQYVWGKFWVNNHAHVLQGKNKVTTEYIYMMFKNTHIANLVTGCAQPKISQGRLSCKEILIPSDYYLSMWNNQAKNIFKQLRFLYDQIKNLTEARDRLLPKLMNGEIEV